MLMEAKMLIHCLRCCGSKEEDACDKCDLEHLSAECNQLCEIAADVLQYLYDTVQMLLSERQYPPENTPSIELDADEKLAQLAEEASELAQAALKLRRALNGKNPTPMDSATAYDNLVEEACDVQVCLRSLAIHADEDLIQEKFERWVERIANK